MTSVILASCRLESRSVSTDLKGAVDSTGLVLPARILRGRSESHGRCYGDWGRCKRADLKWAEGWLAGDGWVRVRRALVARITNARLP